MRPKLHKGDIVLLSSKEPNQYKWKCVVIILKIHKSGNNWFFDTVFGADIDGKIVEDLVKDNWIYDKIKIKKLGHIKL